MACPTVSKFLCCITLETGGLIMGWLTLLFSVLFIAYMGVALAIVIALYSNFESQFPQDEYISTGVFIFVVAVLSIALLYYFILFASSVMLINGTRKRDHTKLMPFMILMCIGIVIHLLSIFTASVGGIVVSILMIFVVIYFYLCTYSLYNKLRNDKLNPPQMQPYAQPIIYAAPYNTQPGVQYVQAYPPQAGVYPSVQSTSAPQPAATAPNATV